MKRLGPHLRPAPLARPERPVTQAQVRSSALTWMELYKQFCDILMDREATAKENRERLEQAEEMADRALERFEARWPGVSL